MISKFVAFFHTFDYYSLGYSMNLKGEGEFRTWIGIIFSLISFSILGFYSFTAIDQLYNYGDPYIHLIEQFNEPDNFGPFNAAEDLKLDYAFKFAQYS